MTIVPGDPASLSACAVTVRGVADGLAREADALTVALAALADGWGGRASVAPRRAGDALTAAAATTASELEHVARVLQDHATDLADLLARARAIDERARAAGLEVRGGTVGAVWGVAGEADAAAVATRDALATALQADLDLVLAQHRRRRDWVLEVLRASTASLDTVSLTLRRG